MREKLNFIKWLTKLPPNERIGAYSIIAIFSLSFLIYGLTDYIKVAIDRDRKECEDNNHRLSIELVNTQNKLEKSQIRMLMYVEDYAKKLERLETKTEMLEKRLNENN